MGIGSLLPWGGSQECHLHGGHAKTANRTLLIMIAAGLSLIIWHVWAYGLSNPSAGTGSLEHSLPMLVGYELRDLFFNGHGIVSELWDVFPYFIVGILLAGYLRTFKIAVKLQASLRRYGSMSIVVASFVGIITPLCACGTLTTAVSLLFAGLPLAPVMSLMVTSALLSPSTYLITLNDLGPEWTVIRTIAALAMGLFAGAVTLFLCNRGFDKGGLFIEGAVVPGDFHDEDYPIEHLRCNCREKFGNRVAVKTGNKFLIFLAKSSEMLWMVGKYVLVGVAIGSIVERYVPYEWIYHFFGGRNPLNIVWVTLASVPLFLHQISASSILAHIKNTLPGTLDGGVGLAFMIGGPVTAIPTMVMFWTIFHKRVFALYMFVCIVGTILIAGVFQWLVFVPGIDTGNQLLKGVASLAGGSTASVVKTGQNSRIVLDSAGNHVIATYTNDVAGHGGVVFDAGFDRFTAAVNGIKDDRHYVTNLATWLGQDADSQERSGILIYTISRTEARDSVDIAEGLENILRQDRFSVRRSDRSHDQKLNEQMLTDTKQLWLLFPDSASEEQLTDGEIKLISEYNKQGNGIVIALGKRTPDVARYPSVNRLASLFGIQFSGAEGSSSRISVGVATQIFASASEMLGRFLKIVHKA